MAQRPASTCRTLSLASLGVVVVSLLLLALRPYKDHDGAPMGEGLRAPPPPHEAAAKPCPTSHPPAASAATCPACAACASTASNPLPLAPGPAGEGEGADDDPCCETCLTGLLTAFEAHRAAMHSAGVLGHADSETLMPLLWRFYDAPTPGRARGGGGYVPPPLTSDLPRAPLVIDVGANVGEVTSAMLHLYTRVDCLRTAREVKVGTTRPPCHSGREVHARVVSFEPSPPTCEALQERARAEQWDLAGWTLVCAAATDRALGGTAGATVQFYANPGGGDRQASIGKEQSPNKAGERVPAYSVDRWLAEAGLSDAPIHLLKVDAEGFDGGVLDGATDALTAGRVQFLAFEYNDKWTSTASGGDEPPAEAHAVPRPYRLASVTHWLRERGYICFLITPHALIPLSGQSFWQPSYEFLSWSNVFCGRREDVAWEYPEGGSGTTGDDAHPLSTLPSEGGGSERVRGGRGRTEPGPLKRLFDVFTTQYEGGGAAGAAQHGVRKLPDCGWGLM